MAADFPASPSNGDQVSINNIIFEFDGNKWKVSNTGNTSVTVADSPPAVSVAGNMYWDSSELEGFVRYNDGNSLQWVPLSPSSSGGGGATGAGGDAWAFEHDNTITTSYAIRNGKNVVSAGPLTVNSGATVTVPSGSTWTIV